MSADGKKVDMVAVCTAMANRAEEILRQKTLEGCTFREALAAIYSVGVQAGAEAAQASYQGDRPDYPKQECLGERGGRAGGAGYPWPAGARNVAMTKDTLPGATICLPPDTAREGLHWMTRLWGAEREWEVWRWSPEGRCWWAHFASVTPDRAAEVGWSCVGPAIPPEAPNAE